MERALFGAYQTTHPYWIRYNKKAKLTIGIVFVELQSTLIPNFELCFSMCKDTTKI